MDDPWLPTCNPLMIPNSAALIDNPLSNSTNKVYKKGDRGSPCLKLLVDLKTSDCRQVKCVFQLLLPFAFFRTLIYQLRGWLPTRPSLISYGMLVNLCCKIYHLKVKNLLGRLFWHSRFGIFSKTKFGSYLFVDKFFLIISFQSNLAISNLLCCHLQPFLPNVHLFSLTKRSLWMAYLYQNVGW